jgi:hypothetical protein
MIFPDGVRGSWSTNTTRLGNRLDPLWVGRADQGDLGYRRNRCGAVPVAVAISRPTR